MDEYHVKYNILTVVTNTVAEQIENIYWDYAKNGWKYQQYIACLDPLGEEQGQMEYSLSPGKYGKFLVKLFQLWKSDIEKGKPIYIRQFDNYIGLLAGYRSDSCDQNGTCSIQNVVEADGSVYPCDFYAMDDYYLGNLNEVRMPEINKRRDKIGFVERSKKLSEACRLYCRILQEIYTEITENK